MPKVPALKLPPAGGASGASTNRGHTVREVRERLSTLRDDARAFEEFQEEVIQKKKQIRQDRLALFAGHPDFVTGK